MSRMSTLRNRLQSLLGNDMIPPEILKPTVDRLWDIVMDAGAVRTPQVDEDFCVALAEFFGHVVTENERRLPHADQITRSQNAQQAPQAPPDVLFSQMSQQSGANINIYDRDESFVPLQEEERRSHLEVLQRSIESLGQEIESGGSAGPVAGPSTPGVRAGRDSCQVEGCELFGEPQLPCRLRYVDPIPPAVEVFDELLVMPFKACIMKPTTWGFDTPVGEMDALGGTPPTGTAGIS